MKLIITCEHGGNKIPPKYESYFKDQQENLASHKGYDWGTSDLFDEVKHLADFSKKSEVSRLLVELNRSLHHQHLFSEVSKEFSVTIKKEILGDYYFPYRNLIVEKIAESMKLGEKIVHLSLHSFTPILNGKVRNTDLGILYDSSKLQEKEFSKKLKAILQKHLPYFKIRYNYPYLGKADGFTTYLRNKFPKNYIGVEIEVNQKYAVGNKFSADIKQAIVHVVQQLRENDHLIER
ncbi:N-formylglutamate amidohydrolase [Mesonia aestuariivivens]|uniref:N-formylglutamate amidohydrolase n=1 Tax=Mesonia aestuariivivens TaxID=2796128 RepID=A0ABS6W2H8_9FLAO|nr:N-formylglutamate amidohydrolase [Mesonia aestuariivivens]MBW2962019.1 N-formylglutamate amidohydrolase [Mesonia aestuariivivens]